MKPVIAPSTEMPSRLPLRSASDFIPFWPTMLKRTSQSVVAIVRRFGPRLARIAVTIGTEVGTLHFSGRLDRPREFRGRKPPRHVEPVFPVEALVVGNQHRRFADRARDQLHLDGNQILLCLHQ